MIKTCMSLRWSVADKNSGGGGSPKGNLNPLEPLVSSLSSLRIRGFRLTYIEVAPSVHWIALGESANCHRSNDCAHRRRNVHTSLRHCKMRELICAVVPVGAPCTYLASIFWVRSHSARNTQVVRMRIRSQSMFEQRSVEIGRAHV